MIDSGRLMLSHYVLKAVQIPSITTVIGLVFIKKAALAYSRCDRSPCATMAVVNVGT